MKNNRHSRPLAIIIILAVALIVGIVADLVWTALDKAIYPNEYEDLVKKYSAEYNVPEDVVFANPKAYEEFVTVL